MRVILVSGFDPTVTRASGIRAYVMALARELVALKQEVTLLGVGSESTELAGVEFTPVVGSIRSSPDFVRALRRFLKRNRGLQGVIHAQRPDDLLAFHSRTPDLPKTVTLHGIHGVHVRARRGAVAGWLYGLAERYSLARTDAALCVSRDTLNHFENRYRKISSIFHMVPAGIDLAMFDLRDRTRARERLGLAPEGKLISYVGRFEPEKNPASILRGYLSIRKTHQDARLAMIGNGRLAGDLRTLAGDSEGSVLILDPMPQDQLGLYLCASDVLVVASRHEGLPTVALESLGCGTPVVGTRVGILPEIIKEGVNGYLVNSAQELGISLEKALYQTEWNATICRESVRGFGWDRVAPAIIDNYRQATVHKAGGTRDE